MSKDTGDKCALGRQALALLSIFILVALYMSLGSIYVFRHLLPLWGIHLNHKIHGLLEVMTILIGTIFVEWVLIFGAFMTWLFLGQFFFTRSDLATIEGLPMTSLDRWLINKFFPK